MGHEPPADVDLDRTWTRVAARVWAPRTGVVERIAAAVLRSPGLARALVTTPSLVLSWLLASAAVLVAGAAVSDGVGTPLVPLLAPALAGVGIAFAYGPGTDPAYELAASMAVSDRIVLLARVFAVFGVNAGTGLLVSLIFPGAAGITWLWLVPMTAVSALCLAVATVSGSAAFGAVAGIGAWSTTVLGAGAGSGADTVLADPMLVAYLLVTVVCAGVVVAGTPRVRKGQAW